MVFLVRPTLCAFVVALVVVTHGYPVESPSSESIEIKKTDPVEVVESKKVESDDVHEPVYLVDQVDKEKTPVVEKSEVTFGNQNEEVKKEVDEGISFPVVVLEGAEVKEIKEPVEEDEERAKGFSSYDQDGDGYIDIFEWERKQEQEEDKKKFGIADANDDSKISQEEYHSWSSPADPQENVNEVYVPSNEAEQNVDAMLPPVGRSAQEDLADVAEDNSDVVVDVAQPNIPFPVESVPQEEMVPVPMPSAPGSEVVELVQVDMQSEIAPIDIGDPIMVVKEPSEVFAGEAILEEKKKVDEKPTEETKVIEEKPVSVPEAKSVDVPTVEAVEIPEVKTVEVPAVKPIEVEVPAAQPVEVKPVEVKVAEVPDVKSVVDEVKAVEEPKVKPVEVPGDKSVDVPEVKAVEVQEVKAVEVPEVKAVEVPEVKTVEVAKVEPVAEKVLVPVEEVVKEEPVKVEGSVPVKAEVVHEKVEIASVLKESPVPVEVIKKEVPILSEVPKVPELSPAVEHVKEDSKASNNILA